MQPTTVLTLHRPKHMVQAYTVAHGHLWIGQRNSAIERAWLSRWERTGSDDPAKAWTFVDDMAVEDCHGWPLHVSDDGATVGVLAGGKWREFDYQPGKILEPAAGRIVSGQVPVAGDAAGGLQRLTKAKVDTFYRGASKVATRKSPGWVQGEYIDGGQLVTIIGSQRTTAKMKPDRAWVAQVLDLDSGKTRTVPVPTSLGLDPDGKPIGGRNELEGARPGSVGVALGRPGSYSFAIYPWSPLGGAK